MDEPLIDTTPRPWYEHARIADETIDQLADVLQEGDDEDDEPDGDLLELLDAKAEYHARKALLGWLLGQSGAKAAPDRARDPRHGRHGRRGK